MKRIVFLVFALVALALSAPAFAAAPPPAVDWHGFYAGAQVGATWGDFGKGLNGRGGNASGGVHGGYNWQKGQYVFGGEIDASGMHVPAVSPSSSFTEDWNMTFRARGGYAMGDFLPYLTAGIALTGTTWNINGTGSTSTTRTGLALGTGVEYSLCEHLSARAEYLYTDVPDQAVQVGAGTFHGASNDSTLRVGVSYHFH